VLRAIKRAIPDEHHKISFDAEIVLHPRKSITAKAGRTIIGIKYIGILAAGAPEPRIQRVLSR